MAPLNDARVARSAAMRLRSESQGLKLTVRGNLARSRYGLAKANLEAEKTRALRVAPLPSPWSELLWSEAHEKFDRTLVPVD